MLLCKLEYEEYQSEEKDEDEDKDEGDDEEEYEDQDADEESTIHPKRYFCAVRGSYTAIKDGEPVIDMCHGCFHEHKAHYLAQGYECD